MCEQEQKLNVEMKENGNNVRVDFSGDLDVYNAVSVAQKILNNIHPSTESVEFHFETVGEIEERCALMIREARIAADEIVTHARDDARRIITEIDRLQNLKEQLERYLESFLDFNSSMLEVWKMGKDGNNSDGDASDPGNK